MRQSWTMLGDARASSVFEIRRSETVCEKNRRLAGIARRHIRGGAQSQELNSILAARRSG
jgi:hypothetical protein